MADGTPGAQADEDGFARLRAVRRRRRRARLRRALLAGVLVALAWELWEQRLAEPLALRELWARVGSRLGGGPGDAASEPPAAHLSPPPPDAFASAPPPAPSAPSAGVPEPGLPGLDESDGWVRSAVGWASSHPRLLSWLLGPDLVRRLTAAVANVATGESPRRQVGFLAPSARFSVRELEGRAFVDPRSHARYDRAAEVFASLDAEACAELYRRSRPLFLEAHAELGHREDFDATLARAFSELLAARVPQGPVELVPDTLGYEFRDPELESLSDAQKHLVRMGPANARKVQAKLRELASALGLEPAPAAGREIASVR